MARKKNGSAPPDSAPAGAPAWVMTFADLMSLLMCFFVLLLSFSEMDAAKYKQVAGSMKFAFGVQREFKTLESPKGVSIIAKEFTPGKPQPTVEHVLRQETTDDNRAYLELLRRGELEKLLNEGTIGGPKTSAMDKGKKPKDSARGGKGADGDTGGKDRGGEGMVAGTGSGAEGNGPGGTGADGSGTDKGSQVPPGTISAKQAARIQATMLSIALEEEIDSGLLAVETQDEGVLVRVREQGSFPSGTANLSGTFLPVLDKIAGALISADSHLIISGHTDNRPISTAAFPSNWMLSAARATSVVEALARRGDIEEQRMEVRAHADTEPVASNDTVTGRARNRRVEIFIGTPPVTPTPKDSTAARPPPEDFT